MYRIDDKKTIVGEITRANANVKLAILLALVLAVLIGAFLTVTSPIDIYSYEITNANRVIEVILIIPIMAGILFFHELIHIGFFYLFGRGEARIKVGFNRSIGAVVIKQVNEDLLYSRSEILIILLSPVVILTVIASLIYCAFDCKLLVLANILLNIIGSMTDMYISFRLLAYKRNVLVNFTDDNRKVAIYKENI